ncbi:MAG TPA: carotenoid oxygenase family protein [Oculatellaceae cyanobacterium]|jgi:hypothetical protein
MNLETIVKDFFHRNTQSYPLVPRSITTSTRQELTDIKLEIDGILPDDIQGHVFIIEPNGSVDSGGLPYPDGNSILCGDGMIYRLDFNQKSEVTLKSKLVKPPDFYADLATQSGTKYNKYRFQSYGITRFSFSLGCRNQLNTAFLPMQFSEDSPTRLLVTYDAGRPYEIDLETLDAVTPVGSTKEWAAGLEGLKVPFQLFMSTAHPVFDVYTKKMFTVNFGRSLNNFLETIPLIHEINKLPQLIDEFLFLFKNIPYANNLKFIAQYLGKALQNVVQTNVSLIQKLSAIEMKDFLYLISWDGVGELERWKLVLPDGSPIKINQCIHQIGVTKDYILIMDTAYSVGIEEIISNPFPSLRGLLERPAVPDSHLYIIRRQDLKLGQRPAVDPKEVEVVVQQVVIPLAAAHFLVDYDNPQQQIKIHIAHICGMKVSDWLRKNDLSAYAPHSRVPSHLCGMIHDEVDIGRMGKYLINGNTGDILESCVISDHKCTWGVELYAYRDRINTGGQPRKLDQIYWCSLGLWHELMTKFIVDLHSNYKYQLVPLSKVFKLTEKGLPSSLFRLDTQLMKIADSYAFPQGYIVLSPQFIPRDDSEDPTNGYLFCTVWFKNKNEFWIFDAKNLSKGPKCKLKHPLLNFGFTLHTAWLPVISPRQASYCIGVREDYEQLVQQQPQEIQDLFEQEIYPHFS